MQDPSVSRLQTIDLVGRIQDGQDDLFDQLVRHFTPRVTAMVMSRMGRQLRARCDPADVAQEVWMRAMRTMKTSPPEPGRFGSWIATIVVRTVSNLASQAQRAPRPEAEQARTADIQSGRWLDPAAEQSTPSQHVDRAQGVIRFVEAIETLPADQRAIAEQYWYEERSTREIADALDKSHAAVRKALTRLNHKLATHLGEPDESEPGDWR